MARGRVAGVEVTWLLLADPAAVLAVDADVVGIDIPIGLPTSGRRDCDLAARTLLGPARKAVFLTPVREVLSAATYPDANALSRSLTGKGLSKQTWHILDRIAAVDEALGEPPDPRVIEVRPRSRSASWIRPSPNRRSQLPGCHNGWLRHGDGSTSTKR